MYTKGLLQTVMPPCEDDDCWVHPHRIYDRRAAHNDACAVGDVFLPHSCDEWVIGGKKEIALLIADLQEILKHMETSDETK